MSTPPGPDWYPDPAQAGRLRYWDGSAWTAWVSQDGETRSDPASPASFPPPAPDQAGAIRAASRRGRGLVGDAPRSADMVVRAGIGLAAIAGVVAVTSVGKVIAAQERPLFGSSGTAVEVEAGVWTAAAAAVALALCAALPWLWTRLVGIGIAGVLGLSTGFAVITSRMSDRFSSLGSDVSLESGGWILVAATFLAFAGMVLALVGVGWLATTRGRPAGNGLSITALVLGIVGIGAPATQPLAVAFGLLGMGGLSRRDGAPDNGSGRGMAIAGLILGLVTIALWWLIVLIAMFVAQPE